MRACHPVTGTYTAVRSDSIVIERDSTGIAAYPRSAITRIEHSVGVHKHTADGIVIGFFAMSGLAFLVFESQPGICHPGNQDYSGTACVVGAGAIGGIPGAVIGGIIGAHSKTELWETIPSTGIAFALAPIPLGISVRLTLKLN